MSPRSGIIRKQRSTNGQVARPLKIVITGPFSAGKTTLIQSISEVAIVGTERDVTDETRSVKERTTVAMDFGRITFAQDLTLFLFGTPGQRRFEVMWEILSEGMIGFILLVNAADDRSLEEASHILDTFRQYADVPYVVGVSHLDEIEGDKEPIFQKIRDGLGLPDEIETIACDPREREDVKALMLSILMGVMGRLNSMATASASS
ncbi:MAG TPA: ATP/GTP-binding protein [Actinomycetota bacterium]|nr:ATP/GTP-binding protein [Actinomycetota bacterium]